MIVNTFISDSEIVPNYTVLSLKRARELNPDLPINFICKKKQPFFDKLSINWVDQADYTKHQLVQDFNKLSWFQRHGTPQTTYPSPDGFWHKTCERIFYLAAYADINNLKTFLHTENDVIMFYSFAVLMKDVGPNEFLATIMSDKQATFAVMYCPTHEHLTNLCKHMLDIMRLGESEIRQYYELDHVSEMSLLRIAMSFGTIDTFKTIPGLGPGVFCFDPGSYGQFLGGTNNGHTEGFKDFNHYAWRNKCEAYMIDGLPYVKRDGIRNPLFNLHIHSKKLEGFI